MLVKNSIVVPHSVSEMFAIVEDIHRYSEFLPGCVHTEMLHIQKVTGEANYRRIARIHIQQMGLKTQFTTANDCQPPASEKEGAKIVVSRAPAFEEEKDPFREIKGVWCFMPMGRSEKMGSKVSIEMEYTFKNIVVEKLLGKWVARTIEGFPRSFVARAHALHSKRSS